MEFYSFSFGDMKVAQADESSPKIIGVDLTLTFKTTSDPATVQTLNLHVTIPHEANQSIEDAERRAFQQARELLTAAAQHCSDRSPDELREASQSQIVRNATSS